MLVGFVAPRPTVRFDGRTEASWGRPFEVGALGMEMDILSLRGGR
jgi:hypothetical protein